MNCTAGLPITTQPHLHSHGVRLLGPLPDNASSSHGRALQSLGLSALYEASDKVPLALATRSVSTVELDLMSTAFKFV